MPSFHLRAYSLWNTPPKNRHTLPDRDKVHPEFLLPFTNTTLWETAGGCCTNTQATWLLPPSLLGLRLLLESGSSQRPACSTPPLLPLATKRPSTLPHPSGHQLTGRLVGPVEEDSAAPVSYTHLTLPTTVGPCRSRWSPYH